MRSLVLPTSCLALGVLTAMSCTSFDDAKVMTPSATEAGAGGSPPSGGQAGTGAGAGKAGAAGGGQGGTSGGGTSGGGSGGGGQGGLSGSSGQSGAAGAGPTMAVCEAPIQLVETAGKGGTVVGTGTAASCTEEAFGAAVTKGGIITFDCGGAATIKITSEKMLPIDRDTTIDGGGAITLDGGGTTRLLSFDGGGYRQNQHIVTLQRLTLRGGAATGLKLTAPAPCSQGTDASGSGGAFRLRDGTLRVIDVTWSNNVTDPKGPLLGGGAIEARAALAVVIVGSTFDGNRAANGGAIKVDNTDLKIYNSAFLHNKATGSGSRRTDAAACPDGLLNLTGEGGDGGVIHSGGEGGLDLCGSRFIDNASGATGGAMVREPSTKLPSVIDRCLFDQNHAIGYGGALHVTFAEPLAVRASTFSRNDAEAGGAIDMYAVKLDAENSTFFGNNVPNGLGGALFFVDSEVALHHVTMAQNQAPKGSGYFGAALASFSSKVSLVSSIFDANITHDCGNPMACSLNEKSSSSGAGNVQWPDAHFSCKEIPEPPCVDALATLLADPLLGDFGDHGGPTPTLLPQAGSPALKKGASCPATDQRGQPRPPSECTAGAVEFTVK